MTRNLFISDLHCGSEHSIAHPRALVCECPKRTLALNKVQRVFYKHWQRMCDGVYDNIFVLGDLVDGGNQKDEGLGLWTANVSLQALCAAKLIMEIPCRGTVYVLAGTKYHRGINPDLDREVVTHINKMGGNAVWLGLERVVELDGCRFHLSHWVSGGIYEGTTLNRELMFSHLYKMELSGIIRGHLHHYHIDGDGNRFAMMLPGWKGRDSYVQSYGLKWSRVQIGWVVITTDAGEYDIQPHLWRLEKPVPELHIAPREKKGAE